MQYEVTSLRLWPTATCRALPLIEKSLAANKAHGEFLACWYAETGILDYVLLIRGYCDVAGLVADRIAYLAGGDVFGLGDLLVDLERVIYTPFPFLDPIRPGTYGPFYEVGTHLLRPDGLASTAETWRTTLPARQKLSPVMAVMHTMSNTTLQVLHIWPYKSLDERQRIRKEAVDNTVWPPLGGSAWLVKRQSDIFLPAPFSPVR